MMLFKGWGGSIGRRLWDGTYCVTHQRSKTGQKPLPSVKESAKKMPPLSHSPYVLSFTAISLAS